ncbi:head completion/stabilization protein [Halopseudomonas bauzanensis]|uniref:head completion/stabilization protein n=1 Tax=Halopseudomonas bauzanensis TaxID=653930 RepID=UPI0035257977
MSAFVASGKTADFTLTNDDWFPDIDANIARETLRLDGAVTDTRLEAALVNAMLSVNQDLAGYKAENAGQHHALEDIPDSEINGVSRQVILYKRAVTCIAGAELVERYRSYDTSADGERNAEALTPSIDELRRDAWWAIRDLTGGTRSTVELI